MYIFMWKECYPIEWNKCILTGTHFNNLKVNFWSCHTVLWHSLVDIPKNKLLVNSDVVVVKYAWFTLSFCCISYDVGMHNNNLQELFCSQTLCTQRCKNLNCFEEKWGMRLWITKWAFIKIVHQWSKSEFIPTC